MQREVLRWVVSLKRLSLIRPLDRALVLIAISGTGHDWSRSLFGTGSHGYWPMAFHDVSVYAGRLTSSVHVKDH